MKLHGYKPAIISKKQKSVIYGAQYLHRPIPELSPQLPTGEIKTSRVGTPEVYAERVYGVGSMMTSWQRVQSRAVAWDLRETYDNAWAAFHDEIIDWTVSPDEVQNFTSQFDLVISTIPLWAICTKPQEHYFKSLNILVKKDVDFDLSIIMDRTLGDNWVVYNGTHDYAWYRCSSIFGHTSAEARSEPHLQAQKGWEPGFKVVGTDCDCHPNVIRAGRMGRWERGILTHHAFERTVEAIAEQFGYIQPGVWRDYNAEIS